MPPKKKQQNHTKLDNKRVSSRRQGKVTEKDINEKQYDDDQFIVYKSNGSESESESQSQSQQSDVETPPKKGKMQKKIEVKQVQKKKKIAQAIEFELHVENNDTEQINTCVRPAAMKAKKNIQKQMEVQSEPDNIEAVQDPEYQPSNEEMKVADEKIFKTRNVFEVNSEDAGVIISISNRYKLRYGDLKLKDHENFRDRSKEYHASLKIWYKNRHKSFVKLKPFIVPQVTSPNEILMNLLNNSVSEQHKAYIAQILENNMPPELQSYYTNLALQGILKDVESYSGNTEQLVAVIGTAPLHLRLKATARAVKLLEEKWQYSNDYKLSWFSHCIKPALTISGRVNYLDFDSQEIAVIRDICEFSNPYQLSDEEAYAYLKLLKYGNVLDLDQAQICGVSKELTEIWTKHKSQMITDAMHKHYKLFNMSKDFANRLSLFQRLSSQDISELYQMSHQRGFSMLADLLSKDVQHDFQLFKTQADMYLRLENPSQIESCRDYLSQTPLEQWAKYKNQIMASSALIGDEKALSIVQGAITKMLNIEGLSKMDESMYSKIERGWVKAFTELNEKTVLQKFGWQKELVIELVHLLIRAGKKNVITTLCTGHGKSIIIQLLADILTQMNADVIIVCLNDFLAHQSRSNYGSLNVRHGRIIYMSIAEFLKMKPDPTIIVIYDEIDSMLGVNSFNLIQQSESITAVYNASLMKQWKSVIGFSGTISQSTLDQLIAELRDPVCIDVPSLRVHGANNKIIGVVKTISQYNLFSQIEVRIMERLAQNENFIVVFEDAKALHGFRSTSAFITVSGKRTCITFDDFSQNFALIMSNLCEVAKDNFIVLTTKEGARGIDYKGVNPAHVIMAFNPQSYSECVQALGRGCRELSSFAEGTIMCKDPLTTDAANYLTLLVAADGELSEAMKLNCRLARTFHDQVVPAMVDITDAEIQQVVELKKMATTSQFHLVLLAFESLVKRGQNIKKVENGDQLWDALRKMDKHSKLPEDFYQRWEH